MLAVLLAGLAAAVLLARPRVGPRRLAALAPAGPAVRDPRVGPQAACAVAAVALALLVGPPAGLVLGLGVLLAGPRLVARLEPREVRAERERLVGDLPLALDLLAACLTGGAQPAAAAAAVGAAVGGPCGDRLSGVAAAMAVGSSGGDAWALLARGPDDPLAPAARMLARAAEGGAPVAATVGVLAAEARADARARGEQQARRVGVLVVAPLGLCFLPAFVLLGVVPVVLGLAGPLLAEQ